jgi:TonB family protein
MVMILSIFLGFAIHCQMVGPATEIPALERAYFPTYPPLNLGNDGTVKVRFRITEEGAVEGIEIISGEPVFLGGAAVRAVRKWRYQAQPGRLPITHTVSFTFEVIPIGWDEPFPRDEEGAFFTSPDKVRITEVRRPMVTP